MTDTCSSCRFWVPGDEPTHSSEHGWGECRRHPPQVVVIGDGKSTGLWPTTTGDQGCGDHELLSHLAALQGPPGEVFATTKGGEGPRQPASPPDPSRAQI